MEEGVHEQDPVRLDAACVKQNRFRWSIEGVCVQDGLDHDQRLGHILTVQHVPVVRGLIGAIVEYLQQLYKASNLR